jgi:hypothetical protein
MLAGSLPVKAAGKEFPHPEQDIIMPVSPWLVLKPTASFTLIAINLDLTLINLAGVLTSIPTARSAPLAFVENSESLISSRSEQTYSQAFLLLVHVHTSFP